MRCCEESGVHYIHIRRWGKAPAASHKELFLMNMQMWALRPLPCFDHPPAPPFPLYKPTMWPQ